MRGMAILPHGLEEERGMTMSDDTQVENDINPYIMVALDEELKAAEKKHPNFADGIYQGVGVIGEEYGELCQALNKGEGEERVMDEALDLICVVWRFCRGDWRKGDEEGYDHTAYDGENIRTVKD